MHQTELWTAQWPSFFYGAWQAACNEVGGYFNSIVLFGVQGLC